MPQAFTRTCSATREKHLRTNMWRFVVVEVDAGGNQSSILVADSKQVLPGRGIYVKKDLNLLESIVRSSRLGFVSKLRRKLRQEEIESILASCRQDLEVVTTK